MDCLLYCPATLIVVPSVALDWLIVSFFHLLTRSLLLSLPPLFTYKTLGMLTPSRFVSPLTITKKVW